MKKRRQSRETTAIAVWVITLILVILLANTFVQTFKKPALTGRVFDLAKCGNYVIDTDIGEVCEINNDTACPGKCNYDCTCSVCGNDQVDDEEECDGVFDLACPGLCQSNCKCPPAKSRALTNPSRFTFYYDKISPGETAELKIPYQKYNLQKIVIKSKETITDVKFTVDANISLPGELLPAGMFVLAYSKIEFGNSSQKDSITRADFDFKVQKTWLNKTRLDATRVRLNRYYNSWQAIPTTNLSEDLDYIYYTARSPGLSVFAISAEPLPPPPQKPIPICGNGIIEENETSETCCADSGCTSSKEDCIKNKCEVVILCGNNACDSDEDYKSCPQDCIQRVFFLPQFIGLFIALITLSALSIIYLITQKTKRQQNTKNI